MSEDILALIITVAILAGLFLWVPTLDVCNDRCRHIFLRGSRLEQSANPAEDDLAA